MLKLTYTENTFNLERINESWETWVNTRVALALSAGTNLCMKTSTAAFLLSAQSPHLDELVQLAPENMIEICLCDASTVEVILKGIWLTSQTNSEDGVFVTSLNQTTEVLLQKISKSDRFCHA
jgi:hypothetical protein